MSSEARYPDDPDAPEYGPPVFKIRNPDPEAIEGNWEWDNEVVESGDVLIVATDYLGPVTTADVLARHWYHRGESEKVLALAEHLLALHHRLIGP